MQVTGADIPQPVQNFEECGFPSNFFLNLNIQDLHNCLFCEQNFWFALANLGSHHRAQFKAKLGP